MKIIIIGGGIMGLACAWRLASGGASVELLEARHCGEGATLAALGALWPPTPLASGPLQQLHRQSLVEFRAFTETVSQASGLPVRYARHGRLELLDSDHTAARAREEAAAAPALGQAMEYLAPERVPIVQTGLRPSPFGALLCAVTAQVMVADLVAALRAACERAGVAIHEQTPVTCFTQEGDRVTGIQTPAAQFGADQVLVTAGAWTRQLPELAHVQVRPLKGQGLALRVSAEHMPTRILKAGTHYLIPWPDAGEVLVGSTTEPEAGFDELPTLAAREALLAGAAAIMPALAGAPVVRQWAGLRPQNSAKRHLPLMGPMPGMRNVWLCTGHFKTGIGMAPLVSRLMAESIVAGRLSDALAPFAPQ